MSNADVPRFLTEEEITAFGREATQALYAAAARKRAADAAAKVAKPPTLTLAASSEPDEQVASVPLEPADVQTVREALAKRSMIINGDIVGFDKVTHARVTMRWTRSRPEPEFGRAVTEYDPFARERLPGYDPGGDRE